MAKKALISVSKKDGIIPLSKKLEEKGYEILSTGGTAKMLQSSGIPVTLIENYTGFPEILDGRVKTLQPKIHAGILANRKLESHLAQMQELGFDLIDIVIVNLYPFEETVAKRGVTLQDAVENIDIGGITLIRAAAKNFESTAIVCEISDYDKVISDLDTNGFVSESTRKKLAVKAFAKTSEYDAAICNYLKKTI